MSLCACVCAKPCKRPQPLSTVTWLNLKLNRFLEGEGWRWGKPTYWPLSCDKPNLPGKTQNKKKNAWLLIDRWSANPNQWGTEDNVTALTEGLSQRTNNKAPSHSAWPQPSRGSFSPTVKVSHQALPHSVRHLYSNGLTWVSLIDQFRNFHLGNSTLVWLLSFLAEQTRAQK